jgi:hypothetical protein
VEFIGVVGMGAQRWIDLGFMRLQPSELTKITLVMVLAAYYDWLDVKKVSRPLWVLIPVLLILLPTALTLVQPDLGTAILLLAGGVVVMFAAGVSWWYFIVVGAGGIGLVSARPRIARHALAAAARLPVPADRHLPRPLAGPLGAGYHITQSKIALGSGGISGRGFMQGTQSRLNFLPEKHTDFIFTTLAEEFGFIGGMSLLALYGLIVFFCITAALQNRDRFSSLLIIGIGGGVLLLLRRQHVDGHGPRPRGGRAPAARQLRRIGDARPHGGLRARPVRPRPQTEEQMINVLFAARPDSWEAYRETLPAAFAAKGPRRSTSGRTSRPEEVDYIVYAPNSRVQDFRPYTGRRRS